MQKPLVVDQEEFRDERMALTNTKLAILFFMTFGLVIAIYAMRQLLTNIARPFNFVKAPWLIPIWLEEAYYSVYLQLMSLFSEFCGTVVRVKDKI